MASAPNRGNPYIGAMNRNALPMKLINIKFQSKPAKVRTVHLLGFCFYPHIRDLKTPKSVTFILP
jgi:hypothetical protein